jgi:hypothetical protein
MNYKLVFDGDWEWQEIRQDIAEFHVQTLLQLLTNEFAFVCNPPANVYSELKGEARDYARVRNACLEQVHFFHCDDLWCSITFGTY